VPSRKEEQSGIVLERIKEEREREKGLYFKVFAKESKVFSKVSIKFPFSSFFCKKAEAGREQNARDVFKR
jgi:hypothetical protein